MHFKYLLCLALLFSLFPLLLARGGGRGGGGKRWSTSSRGGNYGNQGSTSQNGNPTQSKQNKHGYYYHQNPGIGSPNGGGDRSYPGGYINANPNNKILSPHYGGSFGYGGYGSRGGSPFSQSVQGMGLFPNKDSRGFGRRAMIAASGGAVMGMALAYGLGRFPRPYFHFRNPQEERHYNHYMYKRYGTRSTDSNDYSRDYRHSPPPQSYDNYMDLCMKRNDLSAENEEPKNNAAAKPKDGASSILTSKTGRNTNSSRAEGSPNITASPGVNNDGDDDTVSIEEIGYPALMEQLKVRKCLDLYLSYSEKYLIRHTGGAQGLNLSLNGILSVAFGMTLIVINSNMIMLLH